MAIEFPLLSQADAEETQDRKPQREAASQRGEAERWARDPEHGLTVEFYEEHLLARPHARVLDLGAGSGKVSIALAKIQGVQQLVALDYSISAMNALIAGARDAGLENIWYAECETPWNLPFEAGAFDVIVCRYAMHHFTKQVQTVKEVARVLSSGGLLLCSDPVMPEHSRDTTHAIYCVRERSFAKYLTYHELVQTVVDGGFRVLAMRPYDYQRGTLDKYLDAADPETREPLRRAWLALDEKTKRELKWTGRAEDPFITYPILDIAAQRALTQTPG